jgi:hypothetical protein
MTAFAGTQGSAIPVPGKADSRFLKPANKPVQLLGLKPCAGFDQFLHRVGNCK